MSDASLKLESMLFVTEFHQAQLVAAQPLHSRPERGNGQKLVVDGESRSHLEASTETGGYDGLNNR